MHKNEKWLWKGNTNYKGSKEVECLTDATAISKLNPRNKGKSSLNFHGVPIGVNYNA